MISATRGFHVLYFLVFMFGITLGENRPVASGKPNVELSISEDYYFGVASLRSNGILSCNDLASQYLCRVKCNENYACIRGKCYCYVAEEESEVTPTISSDDDYSNEIYTEAFADFTIRTLKKTEHGASASRPTLRHHIAHFCPNLDEARVCIRKCMKLGKPAFCGKDHVCYCGHKTDDPELQKSFDSKSTYAQFKDMYAKYFGPGYKPNMVDGVSDNNDTRQIKG